MTDRLGQPVARGRTAEIYAWEPGWILKLYYDWFSLEDIEYEARLARAVHTSGLRVPDVGQIIRISDRNGLIYERVDGVTMMDQLARQPWKLPAFARRMAELHAGMHACAIAADLPSQRQRLAGKINRARSLETELRSRALAALETLPDGHWLCHGDFHPGNILITPHEPIIIDWIDASLGNPLADLARTTILVSGAINTSQVTSPFARSALRLFHAIYLRQYFLIRPGGQAEYKRWLPVVAAARLSENIAEIENWLVSQVKLGL